jgi:acetolactate synthase I/II/III large subunit
MSVPITRRSLLRFSGATAALAVTAGDTDAGLRPAPPGVVSGKLTGAAAIVETLKAEGAGVVFGIPGAQENELWDEFKSRGLPYLLVTHEFSAAAMADGYARATGRPGVLCVVPGPGVTNSLSGLGEALLDSSPVVAIVGDVAQGEKFRPFQVHALDQVALLKPVTKGVVAVSDVGQIPDAVRWAFAAALYGEPGPVAVVVPYPLLIEAAHVHSPPRPPDALPFDETAFQRALALLADPRHRVGIYAGQGCMNYPEYLSAAAELLQAPVATSVSGKGAIPEMHPLAVGWGYGPQATSTAEEIFKPRKAPHLTHGIDCVLAVGVRYSEVSTGFYSDPQSQHVIHVDANPCNLGKVLRTDVCIQADAGLFFQRLLANADCLRRPPDATLHNRIRQLKAEEDQRHAQEARSDCCGVHPMALVRALRCSLPEDGLLFVDVSVSEHLAAEGYTVCRPRTYFNPTDNQAMGWSIPAALGAQAVCPGRPTAVLTGDGCFLMSAMEISTAARAGLPVKFFVLDDQAYHYMQELQKPAYHRTTATILARLDYAALAQGFGVGYCEISSPAGLTEQVRGLMATPGPVLVRVVTDYRKLKVRWIEAVRKRFTDELSTGQKLRFLARLGGRSLHGAGPSD